MAKSNRAPFRNLMLMAIIAIVLTMLVVGVASAQLVNGMIAQRRWVVHTQNVVVNILRVKNAIVHAELSQREYLLRARPEDLQELERDKSELERQVTALGNLTIDNPVQQTRIRLLKESARRITAELQRSIDLRRSGKIDVAINNILAAAHDESITKFDRLLSDLEVEEQHLLATRSQALEMKTRDVYMTLGFLGVTFFILFSVASALIWFMFRQRERRAAEQRIVYTISSVTARQITADDTIKEVIRTICVEFGWQVGAFWQPTKTGDSLECMEFLALESVTSFEEATRKLKLTKGMGLPGRVWQSLGPVWIANLVDESNFPRGPLAAKDSLKGGFAFPIISGDKFLGVFEFFADRIQRPDNSMIAAFDVVKTEIGLMLERRRTEERLAVSLHELDEAKTMLDSVLSSMGSGVVVADANSKFILFNKAAEAILGVGAIDAPQSEWSETFGVYLPDQKTLCPNEELPLSRALRGENADDVVLFCRNAKIPNGAWISVNGRPLKNRSNEYFGGVVCFEDITIRKEAEKRVSEFYSTVSHELRTPLTSIRGALGLLESGKAGDMSPKAKSLVALGKVECDRLIRLINDILDIRKIEAGKMELNQIAIEPKILVDRTCENLRGLAADAKVVLKSDVECNRRVFADEDKTTQVLTNLVSNAIKFSPRESEVQITVSAARNASFVRFAVTDHGSGISLADQRRLFQLFQQVDSTDSRPKGGTGLGLAISKSLVEKHGGTIGVNSSEGEGSTFWFELPMAAETMDELPRVGARVERDAILLVEDDNAIAQVVSATLGHEGYSVYHVTTVAEAKQAIVEKTFAAIVLDIGLPDGSGLDIMPVLKGQHQVPVVVVSAQSKTSTFGFPLLMDWIAKPFEEHRLLRAVQLAIKRRKPGTARILLVEDDATTREIVRQQVESLPIELYEAGDGNEAIQLARRHQPDLIILDLGLPDVDGFEIVTVLRHDESLRETPLIIYTARDLDDADRKQLQLGLTSYLTKAKTSEEQFVGSVRDLLNGLIKDVEKPGQLKGEQE